jgi:hypothetical protein
MQGSCNFTRVELAIGERVPASTDNVVLSVRMFQYLSPKIITTPSIFDAD